MNKLSRHCEERVKRATWQSLDFSWKIASPLRGLAMTKEACR